LADRGLDQLELSAYLRFQGSDGGPIWYLRRQVGGLVERRDEHLPELWDLQNFLREHVGVEAQVDREVGRQERLARIPRNEDVLGLALEPIEVEIVDAPETHPAIVLRQKRLHCEIAGELGQVEPIRHRP